MEHMGQKEMIEGGFDDLSGLTPVAAREYIAGSVTHLKLLEKDAAKYADDLKLWESRAALARSRGEEALAQKADDVANTARKTLADAQAEIADITARIGTMRKQLPALDARTRSIDPDALEQTLLMAGGYLPGDEEKAAADRDLKEMERNASADAALAALKAKMKGNG